MEPTPARPVREPLTRWERAAVALDVLLGVALCSLVALLVVTGLSAQADPNAPHGGAWEFLGAFLLAPPGLLFLLTAVAVARRWRGRWWMHLLPPLVPFLLLALGNLGLLR